MHLFMAALMALQVANDTVIRVPKDTRLEVNVSTGSVKVLGWAQPYVELQTTANARTQVEARLEGAVLRVSSRARTGVDFAELIIKVPKAMSVRIGTGDIDVAVSDLDANVNILNYRGAIDVQNVQGSLFIKSTLGEIKAARIRGNVEAETTNESVTLSDVAGNVTARSSTKHVTLTRVDGHRVSAETVGGVINFVGPFHNDGQYSFATHMGSIWATVTGRIDATVSVATVSGAFTSSLPYRVTDRRRQGIFTAVFGQGKALVDVESFAGAIVIRSN